MKVGLHPLLYFSYFVLALHWLYRTKKEGTALKNCIGSCILQGVHTTLHCLICSLANDSFICKYIFSM